MTKTSGNRKKNKRSPAPRKNNKRGPQQKGPKFGNLSKNVAFWLLLILLPITLFNLFSPQKEAARKINYSQFNDFVDEGRVKSVTIIEKKIVGKLRYAPGEAPAQSEPKAAVELQSFETYIPFEDPDLVKKLDEAGVEISSSPPTVNHAFG